MPWLTACLAASAFARQPPCVSLPPAIYADTETSTNVPFKASLNASGRFLFCLSCLATPSNNVEVAFGTDLNANGTLEPEEVDRVVGWDCGVWFTRRGADDAYAGATVSTTNTVQTLSWRVQIGMEGTASRLFVNAAGENILTDLPLESVYDPSWNLLCLTGRGLENLREGFSISVTLDGTIFTVR